MKKYFEVSFEYAEGIYCSNLAHAETVEAVEAHYSKYSWVKVSEGVSDYDVELARMKGKPIIEIETPAPAPVETVENAPSETETTEEAQTAPAYTITENAKFGSLEVTFDAKPDEATRDALKALKFRWNGKLGLWYGFATVEAVEAALNGQTAQEQTASPAPVKMDRAERKAASKPSKPDQDRLRIYYNWIKVDGGELIRCSYHIDRDTQAVTIYARDYSGDLPTCFLQVKNESDIITDYFEKDRATVDPGHPLHKYFLYAAKNADAKWAARRAAYYENVIASGRFRAAETYADDLSKFRATVEAFKAERDPGQPTAADLAAIDTEREEAENKRRQAEHEAEIQAREEYLRQRSEGREYIEGVLVAYPIQDGQPTVEITFSENPAFDAWTTSQDRTRTICTAKPDGTYDYKVEVLEPRRRLICSVSAADIILKHFDEKRHLAGRGYDKTDFTINYTDIDTGEPSTYTGRYDLGDNDGGLIAHIRAFGEYYRTHDNFGHVKPEPDETHPALRVADFLSLFCAPRIIQRDELHRYEVYGDSVQLQEFMGGRWSNLGPADRVDESLIDELTT